MHPTFALQRSQKKKREKGPEKIFKKIMAEHFPNKGKETRKRKVTQVQEVQRVPYKINPRRNTMRHILIKLTKIKYKEKIYKQHGKSNKCHTRKLL